MGGSVAELYGYVRQARSTDLVRKWFHFGGPDSEKQWIGRIRRFVLIDVRLERRARLVFCLVDKYSCMGHGSEGIARTVRGKNMTNESFEDRIQEINRIIEELPPESREQLHELVRETRQRFDGIQKSGQAARAATDDLRLHYKYMIFDAEDRYRESQMDNDQKTDGPQC